VWSVWFFSKGGIVVTVPSLQVSFSDVEVEFVQDAVRKIMHSGQLNLGQFTKQFEEEFLPFSGCPYGLSVGTGTVAIEMIIKALGLKSCEIAVQTNTNFATVAAVIHAGTKPILFDCGLYASLESIQKIWNKKIKALVIVHIGGSITPDMIQLEEFCKDNKIFLIEDSAHAHGASQNGRYAGSFGVASAFSFYPTKVITTGEGGFISAFNEELIQKLKILRDQGKSSCGLKNIEMGSSWRISEFQAAVGLSQLANFKTDLNYRQSLMLRYDEHLQKIVGKTPIRLPIQNVGYASGYKYIIQLPSEKLVQSLKRHLYDNEIHTSKGVYDVPIHLQPVFSYLKKGNYPKSDEFCKKHLCLPLWRGMNFEQQDMVIQALFSWDDF
jgi:perosamine synthetase